jgi:ABC-type lipoprotein release transport system permease subunit
MVFWSEARYRRWSWLALALLVALVSGVAMAAAAAGRRTSSAFPRFTAVYGYDTVAYAFKPLPGLPRLPEVASSTEANFAAGGTPRCACAPINPDDFDVSVGLPSDGNRFYKLLSGRLPDPSSATEVLASFSLTQQSGLHIGSVVTVPFYLRSQAAAAMGGTTAKPRGPTVALRVVGIEAAQYEFPSVGTPTEDLWTTPAFARRYGPEIYPFHLYFVRLQHGAAEQARFQTAATKLGALGYGDEDVAATAVETALHPQAIGWWLLAAVAALAGLLTIGQAFARQMRVVSETYPTLSALGLGSSELFALNVLRSVLVALTGAGGGVVLAVALSPLAPVGEARTADPSSGLYADPLVLGLGAVAVVVGCVVASLWPALRSARLRAPRATPPRASSAIVNRLAAAGAPPSAVVGVRRALERGQGRNSVPVGTALIGTILAVLALSATAAFGASLSHLTATPRLYGQDFDTYFSGVAQQPQALNTLLSSLRHNPDIAAVTVGASSEVTINGHGVDAIAGTAVRGPLLLTTVDGRLPRGQGLGKIALGETTLREVGAHIGSVVRVTVPVVSGGTRNADFTVVGTVSFPTDFGIGGLGNGAVFSIPGLVAAQCAPGRAEASCVKTSTQEETQALLVKGVPGPRGRATIARYERRYPYLVSQVTPPINLVNFGEAVNFPLIIGVVLALFGATTLLHMLVVSGARRRSETALLKTLGFVRSQVVAAVAWQSTTNALVGVVIGVPVGIAVGEAVWRLFANSLGVVPVAVVVAWVTVALAGGVVVLANLLALGPALMSARSRPSELLRRQ